MATHASSAFCVLSLWLIPCVQHAQEGSHPFWLANDRVMVDEFFRPSFYVGGQTGQTISMATSFYF
jgi:hypothetical protein